ncbi:MAG: tRNA (adenosine(37)-N6)-threonylcarbamoyltransferase complex ATPase subunit type 1 TsaE, partial [Chloroflexi bacterium]|nr:tRNA (adenosine(37)-N6)-threonylcarbamoyltransferase complex ATPase subunit type 1 TsaE [Chloroflexota bacterium]
MVEIVSHSPAQTQKIGTNLGKMAGPGDLFLLSGQLGAGKTCFTQGIAIGLSIKDYVSSPTFVLVKEYKGRIPLYHIDFYRLDNITDLIDLGLDDYIYGNGVCVIEWAEKG